MQMTSTVAYIAGISDWRVLFVHLCFMKRRLFFMNSTRIVYAHVQYTLYRLLKVEKKTVLNECSYHGGK